MTHALHAGLEIARCLHALEQGCRQWCAGLVVGGEQVQYLALPTEIFHELRGQLDRVPGHAVDAGHADPVHAREHVVQAVAEFVE